jgi:mRNA-degrading endonuclease toxin of MazEF toxin-antitoxin module
MKRGEVWWHEPPDQKRRPVLVLTRDDHIGRQLDVIGVPITSNIRGWDTEITLDRDDGMLMPCVLTLHDTASAEKIFLTKHASEVGAVPHRGGSASRSQTTSHTTGGAASASAFNTSVSCSAGLTLRRTSATFPAGSMTNVVRSLPKYVFP